MSGSRSATTDAAPYAEGDWVRWRGCDAPCKVLIVRQEGPVWRVLAQYEDGATIEAPAVNFSRTDRYYGRRCT